MHDITIHSEAVIILPSQGQKKKYEGRRSTRKSCPKAHAGNRLQSELPTSVARGAPSGRQIRASRIVCCRLSSATRLPLRTCRITPFIFFDVRLYAFYWTPHRGKSKRMRSELRSSFLFFIFFCRQSGYFLSHQGDLCPSAIFIPYFIVTLQRSRLLDTWLIRPYTSIVYITYGNVNCRAQTA